MPFPFAEKIRNIFKSQKRVKNLRSSESIKKFVTKRPAWVQGAITTSEMEFLYHSILDAKPESIVEVGVASGNSTATILKAIADLKLAHPKHIAHLHAFDISPYCYFDHDIPVGTAVDEMIPAEKDHLSLHAPHTVLDFDKFIEKESIHFLFIDANHDHPWPSIDLYHALPYLSKDAVVCFHDINLPNVFPAFPCWGVKYLFDKIEANKSIIEEDKPNIGLFSLDSTSKKALRETIHHVLENYDWQTEIPENFLKDLHNK